jgi:hypothetical protein
MKKVVISFIQAFFIVFISVFIFSSVSIQASEDPDLLKVAYINHFTQFIEWPNQSPTADLKIGVIGTKEIYRAFILLSKEKKIQSRSISVEYSETIPTAQYHILFISSHKKSLLNEILQRTKKQSTLLITHFFNAAQRGAHINFYNTKDQYLRFEVNMVSFKKSNIKISSKLLKLAKIVRSSNGKITQ